jgi:hypothetical protein
MYSGLAKNEDDKPSPEKAENSTATTDTPAAPQEEKK